MKWELPKANNFNYPLWKSRQAQRVRKLRENITMSKVGESIIQGAKEALEFAQSEDNSCEGNVSDTDVSEGQSSVLIIRKELKIE